MSTLQYGTTMSYTATRGRDRRIATHVCPLFHDFVTNIKKNSIAQRYRRVQILSSSVKVLLFFLRFNFTGKFCGTGLLFSPFAILTAFSIVRVHKKQPSWMSKECKK